MLIKRCCHCFYGTNGYSCKDIPIPPQIKEEKALFLGDLFRSGHVMDLYTILYYTGPWDIRCVSKTRTFGKRFIVWTGGGGGGGTNGSPRAPLRRSQMARGVTNMAANSGNLWSELRFVFCNFFPVFIFHLKYKKLLPPTPFCFFFFFFLVFFLVLSFFCISYIQLLKWLKRWTVKLCTGHCSVGNSGCSPLITPPPPPPPHTHTQQTKQNTPLTTTRERETGFRSQKCLYEFVGGHCCWRLCFQGLPVKRVMALKGFWRHLGPNDREQNRSVARQNAFSRWRSPPPPPPKKKYI